MKPGVYVHIPFCEQRCYYCAFTVAVSPEQNYAPYVRRLIREIELSGFQDEPETIFFGGGTPSIIDAELVGAILDAIPGSAKEVSLEVNPGTLSASKLDRYKSAGVNRISLGAQSFHDEDLRNAGRLHRAADVFRDIECLRKYGFHAINIDLIAGLRGQSFDLWRQNLEYIGGLRPEHVSIYMLDKEERSAWGKHPSGGIEEDDVFVRFYLAAAERLETAGYVHYEISNWALPGSECLHNLKYWTGVPYRGFGVSAHSFANNRRFWNTESLKTYAEMLDADTLPVSGEEELTPEIRLQEAFMLGLRRISGFDVWRVAEDVGIRYPSEWFDHVSDLEDAGWIQFDGKVLRLTAAGWLLATGITQELLWPIPLSTFEVTP
jgi:oxygen-independent coproporphyrinogen III oxidase